MACSTTLATGPSLALLRPCTVMQEAGRHQGFIQRVATMLAVLHTKLLAAPAADAPGVGGSYRTQTSNASCSTFAPFVPGFGVDCGDWPGGVRYTYNNLQEWQKYYNWHDGMTSSWNFNFRNTERGYEEWNNWPYGGGEPNGGTGEPNAQFLTNGLFNDLHPNSGLGYLCRSWSELHAG